jgi:hypothetical protein
MSRRNKVNPDHYTTAGRLSPDDLARERKKQAEQMSARAEGRDRKPMPPWMANEAAGAGTALGEQAPRQQEANAPAEPTPPSRDDGTAPARARKQGGVATPKATARAKKKPVKTVAKKTAKSKTAKTVTMRAARKTTKTARKAKSTATTSASRRTKS